MKIKLLKQFNAASLALALLALLTFNRQFSTAHAQGTAFTYQGKLNNGANAATGSYDFRFRLASDNQGNTYVGSPFLINGVPVTNGLFTTLVDFGTSVFTGYNYWLEVDVRTNGAGSYTVLSPLQVVTPVPYAVMANSASNLLGSLPASQLSGTIAGAVLPPSPNFSGAVTALSLAGNGGNVTNVNARALNGLVATNFWQLGGNNVAAGQFLGSTNNQPVEVRVGGMRGWQLTASPTDASHSNSVNIIGGSVLNYIAPGVYGSVIGGGGAGNYLGQSYSNSVLANFSVIGGGYGNNIEIGADASVIIGGRYNTIQMNAYFSTIGGQFNVIQTNASSSTISGGSFHEIQTNAVYSTISGGYNNTIRSNATYSTISGGANNIAGGSSSFAAGNNARALNDGTFVWSDGTAVTASTTANSVTMRASGGYRFFTGNGAAGAQLAAGGTAWTTISDRNAKKNFQAVDTIAVLEKLAVLPVQQWNYQWEKDNDVPNLGPMAQDFKAAFYPGRDDKGISTLEFDGVELAAIQGLDRKLNAKDAEIQALKAKTAKMDLLEKQLAELELQVKLLAEKK